MSAEGRYIEYRSCYISTEHPDSPVFLGYQESTTTPITADFEADSIACEFTGYTGAKLSCESPAQECNVDTEIPDLSCSLLVESPECSFSANTPSCLQATAPKCGCDMFGTRHCNCEIIAIVPDNIFSANGITGILGSMNCQNSDHEFYAISTSIAALLSGSCGDGIFFGHEELIETDPDDNDWPELTDGSLSDDITSTDTEIPVDSSTDWSSAEVIRIGDEFMTSLVSNRQSDI